MYSIDPDLVRGIIYLQCLTGDLQYVFKLLNFEIKFESNEEDACFRQDKLVQNRGDVTAESVQKFL